MVLAYVTARSAVSSVGVGCASLERALRAASCGLRPNDFDRFPGGGFIGRVDGIEAQPLPQPLAAFDCRNHRLANAALGADGFDEAVARACNRYGADRVAVLAGTSTSGILSTEIAYGQRTVQGELPAWFDYRHAHNYGALPEFIRQRLGVTGPGQCLSTACSSSAKVVASAARWLALGLCDAAVVGGADSLCGTTMQGFRSLQVVSDLPCRPFDATRSGISLGEAAAFLLLEREPAGQGDDSYRTGSSRPGSSGISGSSSSSSSSSCSSSGRRVGLLGYGETADAWHMSAPHPEGAGVLGSMRAALEQSGLEAGTVDFTCAHGTATRANDEIEAVAIRAVFGGDAIATSTKGTTGHALGAAGALSAVIAVLAIEQGFVPATANTASVDPACPVSVPLRSRSQPVGAVMVNALGFGGNNCSLVFGAGA